MVSREAKKYKTKNKVTDKTEKKKETKQSGERGKDI